MFIISPVRTEKAVAKMEFGGTVTFIVKNVATKKDIKSEVEKIFGVKVKNVRMYNTAKGGKRAVVRLVDPSKTEAIAAKLKLV